MKKNKQYTLPITEKEISQQVGRKIKSPIRISNLQQLGIDQKEFIDQFAPYFEELAWDEYDPKRLQIEYLTKQFPKAKSAIRQYFKEYYTGQTTITPFKKWIKKLSKKQQKEFKTIQPWRRRSVATFKVQQTKNSFSIQRLPPSQFAQAVDDTDIRSWPRIFQEAPPHHVETSLFYQFLIQIFRLVQSVEDNIRKVHITAHFMSVKATADTPGNNSPEGAHEDGAAYIVSALVINRFNVSGGETQILEKRKKGKKEIILRHILQPGEFAFQADTGEEKIFGNDLWHHVTPFYKTDKKVGDGWRDIIGLDVVIKGVN